MLTRALRRTLEVATEETGGVLVLFAVFAPVAILLAAFVIDAGNWFEHQRHLQLQADAGVLAAAQSFEFPCEELNEAIYKTAGQYGGAASVITPSGENLSSTTPLYNPQVGESLQSNIHEEINSKKYYEQSPEDDTVKDTPCKAGMVDVKLTETGLPWFFKLAGVSYINAHARVSILQETSASGVEPLAVAESAPVAAAAYFVNEDASNTVLEKTALTKGEPNGEGNDVWSNSSAPLEVPITHPHIGVVIALSGNPNDTTCGDPYVVCFGRKTANEAASVASAEALLHIAGYSTAGSGTGEKPLAREVTLSGNTCADGYFSHSSSDCTFTVSAKVDYGSTNTKGVTVMAEVGGAKPALSYNSTTGLWTGTATLKSGTGSNEVSLAYECKKETGSPCQTATTKTTFKDVHRIFAASEAHSGPITGASLAAVGGLAKDADSFPECAGCAQKLVVTVDVAGSLANAASFLDPLKQLRWEGTQGVRVGCPPPSSPSGSEYRIKLEQGCPGKYTINTSDPSCTANKEPYQCLTAGLPGKDTGPTEQGIKARIEEKPGTQFYCENNWKNNNNGGVPVIPSNDSRIVQLFVLPYGSLNSEGKAVLGSGEVPIQNFATFYVTGFPGDKNECISKGDPQTGNAEIVGHFIQYVTLNGEGNENNRCVQSSFGTCVATLN